MAFIWRPILMSKSVYSVTCEASSTYLASILSGRLQHEVEL